jgi:membrane protein YqaA with SNARE-associated domain
VGGHLIAEYFPGLEHSARWMRAEKWVLSYGAWGLAAIAALPVPQLPPLLILALAKTPTSLIGVAVLAGKLLKYGAYVLGVRLVLKAIHTGMHKSPKSE